ncbi:MAG: hypothetical protein IJ848_00440 [Alphaproteobacteria bacterium]|nr:hypothetical protein [Alphaproteobacteria bacterium]
MKEFDRNHVLNINNKEKGERNMNSFKVLSLGFIFATVVAEYNQSSKSY